MSEPTNADADRALEGQPNPGADTGVAPLAPGSASVTFAKSVRFARELADAQTIRATLAKRGTKLTLIEAHEVWAEHSNDYCAQWLLFDSEDPVAEIWRAYNFWEARHRGPNTEVRHAGPETRTNKP